MMKAKAAIVFLAAAATASGQPQPTPTLRLPGDARPLRATLELTVDPELEAFTGEAEFEIEILKPTEVLWLNASRLEVKKASLGRMGAMRPARIVPGGEDFVGFSTGTALATGPARLRVSFGGTVSRRDNEGIFAVKEGAAWYLFTQFQATAARRALPCFDEPSYKIPWQLTLRVPTGAIALSNTPVASLRTVGAHDIVGFLPTPPLPSYLVAFVVGPFDLVDGGAAGRNRTPTRLAVPRGRAADTAWARESTPRLLAKLEDYFDRPYPYAKLDQVAIPGAGFAMEHPGLVTYGQTLMVQRPSEETIASRRNWASICAHELAHQWFGNLVTLAWWDDTWLNEGFSNWLGEKVTERLWPEWGVATERASSRSRALRADSLSTARRVRQPIESKDDISNAFDGVTYGKGQAILEMFEAWLGEEVFRRGVRDYIARHAGGNATGGDFVHALSAAAGRDIRPVLESFLEQTGAPVVSAEIRCGADHRLVLSQRPYRALGSPSEAKVWNLPVCARVPGRDAPACTVLTAESSEIPLGPGPCPAWSFANAGASGYYRTVLSAAEARHALEGGQLSPAERVALAGDMAALVASGDVTAVEALAVAAALAADTDRHVVDESTRLMQAIEPLVPDDRIDLFRRLVRAAYSPLAASLGWRPQPGDSEDVRLLRRSVVEAAAVLGRDPALERGAAIHVARWLEDPSALDPDLVETAIAVAVGAGEASLFPRLLDDVTTSTERERRERLLVGLGGARDPAFVRQVLALTLDERVDPRESIYALRELCFQRETRRLAFDFLKANYEALVARLPQGELSIASYLPWLGVRLCAADTRRELEDFFGKRSADIVGAQRVLAQALESIDQCVARKQAHEAGLASYLASLP